jgi:hypothetical protein
MPYSTQWVRRGFRTHETERLRRCPFENAFRAPQLVGDASDAEPPNKFGRPVGASSLFGAPKQSVDMGDSHVADEE